MTVSRPMIASTLPEVLPIFPLSGAVLLPNARLPLNIFEPRYLAMFEDALGSGRLIGMIQPSGVREGTLPSLYSVGCVGRITSFNETDDGRMLVVLTGVCRFRVTEELPSTGLYRSVKPDWKPYMGDLSDPEPTPFDRVRLIDLLQVYFKKNSITLDWSVVQNSPDDVLVPTIIMISPLAPNEKQALLEAEDFSARVAMLEALLEMALSSSSDNDGEVRH